MQKLPILNAWDMLSAVNGGVAAGRGQKTQNGFRELLGEAIQIAGAPAAREKAPQQGRRSKGVSGEPAQAPADAQPDATVSEAAAMAAAGGPQAAPAAEATQEGQAVAVETGGPAAEMPALAQAAPADAPDAAQQAVPPSSPSGGDILSFEASVAETGEAAPVQAWVPGQIADDAGTQDRFDDMLDQAQQRLQRITGQNETQTQVQAQDQTEANVTETEPGVPVENGRELPLIGEDPVAEDAAGPPDGEDPMAEDVTEQDMRERTQNRAELRPGDQRTLRELPETDRAVMEMRDAITAERQPAEAARPEPARAPEPQQPQPQQPAQRPQEQQPLSRTDQTDQIRAQVTENLRSNTTEFRMQLAPEELGRINVRLVIDAGRLAVEIMSSDSRTVELLSRQAASLGQALRANTGMEVGSINVVSEPVSASGNMGSAFSTQTESGAFQGQPREGRASPAGRQAANGSAEQPAPDEEARAPRTLLNYTV